MQRLGFIHDMLDVKVLILFVMSKVSYPVNVQQIYELCYQDDCLSYFDVCTAIPEMVKSGHLKQVENDCYEITDKGRRNVNAVATSLPYTVRAKADKLAAPVAAAMRRSSLIETDVQPADAKGGQTVSLRMSDGLGEVIGLRLAVPNEEQADIIVENFRASAEDIYNRIILLLTKEGEE